MARARFAHDVYDQLGRRPEVVVELFETDSHFEILIPEAVYEFGVGATQLGNPFRASGKVEFFLDQPKRSTFASLALRVRLRCDQLRRNRCVLRQGRQLTATQLPKIGASRNRLR